MQTTSELEQAIHKLHEAYAAFNRGDIAGAVAAMDPEVEWTEPPEFPGGGTYRGPAEVMGYLTQSRAAWADVRSEPEQFIPVGARIVVFVHARVRAKDSTVTQDVSLADVYTFRDGKVINMRAFADRQDALRWAGLQSEVRG
jgi:uncharacterized protein